jgi:hypothetical protein
VLSGYKRVMYFLSFINPRGFIRTCYKYDATYFNTDNSLYLSHPRHKATSRLTQQIFNRYNQFTAFSLLEIGSSHLQLLTGCASRTITRRPYHTGVTRAPVNLNGKLVTCYLFRRAWTRILKLLLTVAIFHRGR